MQDAVLYLVQHEALGAVKVGIANTRGRRIKQHRAQGWVMLASIHVYGEVAETIEAGILDWCRNDLGLPPYLSKNEMPQCGWTETVDADAIDILATIKRIKILAATLLPSDKSQLAA
jgi:hypothetical protein